ncbi:MAG: hypothetical protein K2Q20_10380, partial [Phycisphaerales bacterium]|nr:hypothetical protein [Phycisphaerales bacterium]
MPQLSADQFVSLVLQRRGSIPAVNGATGRTLVVPLALSLLDDQLTPVVAYRRLVAPDERTAPSFLLESVEGGERQGRHSILSAQPSVEILAKGHDVEILRHGPSGTSATRSTEPDPLEVPRRLSAGLELVSVPGVPRCFLGGWVGFAGYDTVRYAEPVKLDAARAPLDDRRLPDLHMAFYDGVVVFDHVDKLVYVVALAHAPADAAEAELRRIYARTAESLEARCRQLQTPTKALASGRMDRPGSSPAPMESNLTRAQHAAMVDKAMEYIRAGDIFQVVVGQRFVKRSPADPFDVYRAL